MCHVIVSIRLWLLRKHWSLRDLGKEQEGECFRCNLEPSPAVLQASARVLTVTRCPQAVTHLCLPPPSSQTTTSSDCQAPLSLWGSTLLWTVGRTFLLFSLALSEEDYRADWFTCHNLFFPEDTGTLVGVKERGTQVSEPLSQTSSAQPFRLLPPPQELSSGDLCYPHVWSCLSPSAHTLASDLSDNCLCMNVYVGIAWTPVPTMVQSCNS